MKPEDLLEKITFSYNPRYLFRQNTDPERDNSEFMNIVDLLHPLIKKHSKSFGDYYWFTSSDRSDFNLYLRASGNFKEVGDFLEDLIYLDSPGYESKVPHYVKYPVHNLKDEGKFRERGLIEKMFENKDVQTTNFAFDCAQKLCYSRGFVFGKKVENFNQFAIYRSSDAHQILHPDANELYLKSISSSPKV